MRRLLVVCPLVFVALMAASCGGKGADRASDAKKTLTNLYTLRDQKCSHLFSARFIRANFKSEKECDASLSMAAALQSASDNPSHKAFASAVKQKMVIAYKAAKAASIDNGFAFPKAQALARQIKNYEPELKFAVGS